MKHFYVSVKACRRTLSYPQQTAITDSKEGFYVSPFEEDPRLPKEPAQLSHAICGGCLLHPLRHCLSSVAAVKTVVYDLRDNTDSTLQLKFSNWIIHDGIIHIPADRLLFKVACYFHLPPPCRGKTLRIPHMP